jgi:hypothetical protein
MNNKVCFFDILHNVAVRHPTGRKQYTTFSKESQIPNFATTNNNTAHQIPRTTRLNTTIEIASITHPGTRGKR